MAKRMKSPSSLSHREAERTPTMFGPNTLSFAVLMALIVAIGPVSTNMYLVSLSILPEALGTTIDMAQLTVSVFLAAYAIAQLFAGALADRFGRKPVVLGGLALFFVSSVACALATSIEALITFRFVQALGACTATVLPRAIVRDLHTKEQAARMLGYMGLIMGIAPIIGPILGSYLTVWFGWQANFWLMTGYCVVTMALVAPLLRESLSTPDRSALDPVLMVQSLARLLSHRAYLGYWLTFGLINGAMFAFFTVASFLIIDLLAVQAERFGLYFGVVMVGYLIGSFATGRYSERIGIDVMMKASAGLAAMSGIAGLVLAWIGLNHTAAVVVPMFALMVSVGFLHPLCLALALAPFPQMAGKAASLLGFSQMAFGAAGSITAGLIHDGTAIPPMALIAFLSVSSFAAYRFLIWGRPALDDHVETV